MHPYTQDAIAAALHTAYLGRRLVFLQSTPSTQDVAKDLAAEGAPDGTLVVADSQSAGRGRLGRSWVAPPGTSLLLSLILRPPIAPAQIHRLTMLCSLSVVDAVTEVAGLRLGVKWPNDVVTWPTVEQPESRKLAGLLAESTLMGDKVGHCVVGIGLNVNLELADLPATLVPATSLRAETGRDTDRTALLAGLLMQIERRYQALKFDQHDAATLAAEWSSNLVTLGRQVVVTDAENSTEGTAVSVTEDGALIVRTANGTLHTIAAGDVTLRRATAA